MVISMMKLIKNGGPIDEEAADVVRNIFNLRKKGESVNGIAKILKKEKIYITSVYAIKKGFKKWECEVDVLNKHR